MQSDASQCKTMKAEMLCPAKINLHLAVGPRDLAGPFQPGTPGVNAQKNRQTAAYHRVCTLLQAIYLYKGAARSAHSASNMGGDVLALELPGIARKNLLQNDLQNNVRLECRPAPPPCAEHENLVCRAAKSYLQFYSGLYGRKNWPEQFQFRLAKQIPQQAGLGGGSSNAAAALKLLNKMLPQYCGEAALNDAQLLQIAAGLGSDIPFFLQDFPNRVEREQSQFSSLAWGLEWGQKIVPLSAPLALAVQKWQSRHQLWIVKPKNVSCPTAAMYRLLGKRPAPTAGCYPELEREMASWAEPDFGRKLRCVLQNDFLRAICNQVRAAQPNHSANPSDLPDFSVLVTLWQYLYSLRASWVSLCGSGAALFAWFPAEMETSQIFAALSDFPEELEIFAAHPL